jgi:hypothetical protein
VYGGIAFGIEDHLRDAGPIAQIDEHYRAVIPAPLDPAVQYDRLPHLFLGQLTALMSPDFHHYATFVFFGRAQPSRRTGLRGRGGICSPRSTISTRSSTNSRNALASRSVKNRNSPGSSRPNDNGPILTLVKRMTGWPWPCAPGRWKS